MRSRHSSRNHPRLKVSFLKALQQLNELVHLYFSWIQGNTVFKLGRLKDLWHYEQIGVSVDRSNCQKGFPLLQYVGPRKKERK